MKYVTEPVDRIYVKGYGFLSFANNIDNKYGKKLPETTKKQATNTLKTASKSEIWLPGQQVIWLEIRLQERLQRLLQRGVVRIQENVLPRKYRNQKGCRGQDFPIEFSS